MRVLIFSSSYSPRVGGLETVTEGLAGELAGVGHEVMVITNRYPRSLPRRDVRSGIDIRRQLYPYLIPGTMRRPWHQRLKGLLLVPLAPAAFLSLLRLTRQFSPDVINIHYFSYPSAFMLMAGRLLSVPIVLSFHGSDLSSVPYPATYESVLRWACRMSTAFTVPSSNLAQYLIRIPSAAQKPVLVARNAIQIPDSFGPLPEVPGKFPLVVARLVEKKGVDVAIAALADLRKSGFEIDLVIVGDGPLRTELEQFAAQLEVLDRCHFLGEVPHESVLSLIQASELLVVPSRWEAFGVVCLEGMMLRKAIVASATGGIPETVVDGETGLLVPPGDPQALAIGIQTLLEDPKTREAMGRRGRERVEKEFTWPKTRDVYLEAYRAAVEQTGRAAIRAQISS